MNKNNLQNERELIYLLLHYRDAIDYFFDSDISPSSFCEENRPIVLSILELYDLHGILLTRKTFRDRLEKHKIPKDKIAQEMTFNACYSARVNINDLPLLVNRLIEENIQIKINGILNNFKTNVKIKDNISAIKTMANECNDLLDGSPFLSKKAYYEDIRKLSETRTQYIRDVREGKIKEEPLVLSGIKEIDYTMVTGFEKGTLTLICADVGVYKSTTMLNIGLNVWKFNHNVLFVPLEMNRDQMWRRACAREARIKLEILTRNIKDMTPEQFEKIEKMNEGWEKIPSKFYIMEEPGNTTVSKIERQIERNIEVIKPKLVVIDYIANLTADRERYERNDLEIGDMLKSMRQMGKDLDFAVLSAAQIGREALKRLRKAGANRDKPTINSEDIRGSHEYAADADNIYAQLKSTSQPTELLDLYAVKSRNGPTTFEDGSIRAMLEIQPQYGIIKSLMNYDEINDDDDDDDILGEMIDKTESDEKNIKKGSLFDEEIDDIVGKIEDIDEMDNW